MAKEVQKWDALPSAAQRWLAHALPGDPAPLAAVRLRQEGEMEVRGRWMSFTAVADYRADPLAFEWRARLAALPGVWIAAEDGQDGRRGWGGASLWGAIPLGRREDVTVLHSQLVRNLGELPWLPWLALAASGLRWRGIDEDSFEVAATAGGRDALVRFTLDEQNGVRRADSPARPYDVPGGYEEAPWQIIFDNHRDFNGARLPQTAVMTFSKPDEAWEYMRVRLVGVE